MGIRKDDLLRTAGSPSFGRCMASDTTRTSPKAELKIRKNNRGVILSFV